MLHDQHALAEQPVHDVVTIDREDVDAHVAPIFGHGRPVDGDGRDKVAHVICTQGGGVE